MRVSEARNIKMSHYQSFHKLQKVLPSDSLVLPSDLSPLQGIMKKKPRTTKPGTVQKIVKPIFPGEPEKAQIVVEGAEPLYRELRVENTLTDEKGHEVSLKEGAHVDVVVEAEPEATKPKSKS